MTIAKDIENVMTFAEEKAKAAFLEKLSPAAVVEAFSDIREQLSKISQSEAAPAPTLKHHVWCNYWTKPIGSPGCICEEFAALTHRGDGTDRNYPPDGQPRVSMEIIEKAANYGWQHANWTWPAIRGGLDRFQVGVSDAMVDAAREEFWAEFPKDERDEEWYTWANNAIRRALEAALGLRN